MESGCHSGVTRAGVLIPRLTRERNAGRDAFKNYVRSVRAALADYQCKILSCVAEENQAFVKMYFSGRHVAAFRGYEPTGKLVQWLGAALFRFEDSMIAELWVLGDLARLDSLLKTQAAESAER
jgi:predicted ester cyclase